MNERQAHSGMHHPYESGAAQFDDGRKARSQEKKRQKVGETRREREGMRAPGAIVLPVLIAITSYMPFCHAATFYVNGWLLVKCGKSIANFTQNNERTFLFSECKLFEIRHSSYEFIFDYIS